MSRHHYVMFVSPGTFFHEETTKPIPSWDIATAVEMGNGIVERHGAKPFAFVFKTLLEAEPVPDGEGGTLKVEPKKLAESGRHFLGGEVFGHKRIQDRHDPKDDVLLSNMRCNGWAFVVENNNSWRSVQPFEEDDVLLDTAGAVVVRGNDPVLMQYRREFQEETRRLYERT